MREEKIRGIFCLLCSVKLAIIPTLFVCWNLVTRLKLTEVSFLFSRETRERKTGALN